MDAGLDTRTGLDSTSVADRLRERDPASVRAFLVSWAGAVMRYCRTVCEPELVAEAVEVIFADFFEKVDSHPIRDANLESALMRSTRLTAAEAARVDWDEPGTQEDDPATRFDCAQTPPFLAGSPSAPASLPALARMDEHVLACRRCQASTRRFQAAEKAFPKSKGVGVREDVLDELLRRLVHYEPEVDVGETGSLPPTPHQDVVEPGRWTDPASTEPEPAASAPVPELAESTHEPQPAEPEPGESATLSATTVDGFRIVAIGEENPDGVVLCTAIDEDAQEVALRLAPIDADPGFRSRFLSEARLLAAVSHPSLPPVLALGEAPDGAYVVTKELRSRSLVSVTEMGLPIKQVIHMLAQAAGAIDALHAEGLLHRQVRPANIVVGAWLIVRPLVVNPALGRPPDVVLGDAQASYMSPEEARRGTAGPASDRYALACTLFEFLTGDPPFGRVKDAAIDGHLNGRPPRATQAGPDLPQGLDDVFERALSKSPDGRFSTAAELVSHISEVLFGSAISAPETRRRTDETEPTTALEPSVGVDVSEDPVRPENGHAADEAADEAPDEAADEAADEPVDAPDVEGIGAVRLDDDPEQPEDEPEGRWLEHPGELAEREVSDDPEPAAPPEGAGTPPRHQDQITDEMDGVTFRENGEGLPPLPPFESTDDRRRGPSWKVLLAAVVAVAAVLSIIVVVGVTGGGSSDEEEDASKRAPEPRRVQRKPAEPSRAASVPVALSGARATDYDPNGGNGEQPERVGALVDGNAQTAWQTDRYPTGTFGEGVGAYISLPRPERLKELEIRTTSAGWDAEIYGAPGGPPGALPAPGWIKLGGRAGMRGVQRIRLGGGSQPVRHALVWITKLPREGMVSIAEVRLFR